MRNSFHKFSHISVLCGESLGNCVAELMHHSAQYIGCYFVAPKRYFASSSCCSDGLLRLPLLPQKSDGKAVPAFLGCLWSCDVRQLGRHGKSWEHNGSTAFLWAFPMTLLGHSWMRKRNLEGLVAQLVGQLVGQQCALTTADCSGHE